MAVDWVPVHWNMKKGPSLCQSYQERIGGLGM